LHSERSDRIRIAMATSPLRYRLDAAIRTNPAILAADSNVDRRFRHARRAYRATACAPRLPVDPVAALRGSSAYVDAARSFS
jgi:hypothetical protein